MGVQKALNDRIYKVYKIHRVYGVCRAYRV